MVVRRSESSALGWARHARPLGLDKSRLLTPLTHLRAGRWRDQHPLHTLSPDRLLLNATSFGRPVAFSSVSSVAVTLSDCLQGNGRT